MINLKPYANTLQHNKVGVFGLGLSGLASVRALIAAGVDLVAWDDSEERREAAQKIGASIENLSDTLDHSFDFLLLSPGVPLTHPKPHDVVKKANAESVEIIGDIELLHRSAHGLKTIGITGTNGKSTTTALMAHVLNENNVKAIAAGNIGKPALELDLEGVDVLVLEMSSYQLDLCPSYHPDISILLNITPDHLDRHGTMENYRDVKAKIFDGNGLGIISVDDDYTQYVAEKITSSQNREVQKISVRGSSDIYVEEGVLYDGQDEVGSLTSFETLKGIHNYQNCASVYAAAKALKLEGQNILKAMASYAGLPHRQHKVTTIKNVSFINDSKATNAESAAKALSSYNNIYWIAGGQSKENGLSGLENYKSRIHKAYLIGEATDEFLPWFENNQIDVAVCHTLDRATQEAYQNANDSGEESTVLLAPACASWDQFKSFEHRGEAFVAEIQKIKEARE